MKYSVLISTQRWSGLLSHLTSDLFRRGIFPDFMSSETLGSGSVRIRLEFHCDERTIMALPVYWEQSLRITMAIVTRIDGKESPVPVSPSALLG